MSMLVCKDMIRPENPYYFSVGFRQIIEDHIEILASVGEVQVISVAPEDAKRNDGDLYGLLTYLKVPEEMHYPIMRVNNLYTPTDYRASTTELFYPDSNLLDNLLQRYRNVNTIL